MLTKPKNRLSMGVRYQLTKRLEECLNIIDDETANYKDGYSDDTIAAEFGIRKQMVANTRRSIFGHFSRMDTKKIKVSKDDLDAMYEKISDLISRVEYLEDQLEKQAA